MNRSSKYNFYLPQSSDLISVSDFNYNFGIIDSNLITETQTFTDTQKSTARTNIGAASSEYIKLQSLITRNTFSSSYQTFNTYDARKISDFQFLAITVYRDLWAVGSIVIPRGNFVTATGAYIHFTWSSTPTEVFIKYDSDTSVQAKYNSTDTGTMRFEIIGIVMVP